MAENAKRVSGVVVVAAAAVTSTMIVVSYLVLCKR